MPPGVWRRVLTRTSCARYAEGATGAIFFSIDPGVRTGRHAGDTPGLGAARLLCALVFLATVQATKHERCAGRSDRDVASDRHRGPTTRYRVSRVRLVGNSCQITFSAGWRYRLCQRPFSCAFRYDPVLPIAVRRRRRAVRRESRIAWYARRTWYSGGDQAAPRSIRYPAGDSLALRRRQWPLFRLGAWRAITTMRWCAGARLKKHMTWFSGRVC